MNSPGPAKIQLFGLAADRGRWLLIPLGMAFLLCLGTVYSWSVFRRPLESELAIGATESLLPYTVALVCYAMVMPIAGFYMLKLGPRRTAALGGVVVSCGYLLASFSSDISTITFSYGVINGVGVGLAYGVPMAVVARWFPDRKGLAVGLTIVGFGLSPLITAPIANALIEGAGLRSTLRVLAVVFGVMIVTIASTLRLPPEAWTPSSAGPSKAIRVPSGPGPAAMENRTALRQLLRSRTFYGLWMGYALAACVGLSAIGISGPVGVEIIQMSSGVAARSVALFALFNGLSRPLFGWLTDRYRPQSVAVASYLLILVACILMVHAKPGDVATYLIAFSLFWFCLGGWLALAPTATLKLFDPKDYAMNYGIVFTAYGVGALFGTLVAGRLRDLFGSYVYAFYPMAALAIVGIGVTSWLLKANGPAQY